jgi:hypothetical protein
MCLKTINVETMRFKGGPCNDDSMFAEKQRRKFPLLKKASAGAEFHFSSNECDHDILHTRDAHSLPRADPFECINCN